MKYSIQLTWMLATCRESVGINLQNRANRRATLLILSRIGSAQLTRLPTTWQIARRKTRKKITENFWFVAVLINSTITQCDNVGELVLSLFHIQIPIFPLVPWKAISSRVCLWEPTLPHTDRCLNGSEFFSTTKNDKPQTHLHHHTSSANTHNVLHRD